jgi:hypothetical protein
MANTLSNWQDAINSQLLGRLVLPLTQAGVMKRDMSQKIIDRSDRFLNRLPLLSQQMQRWGNLTTLSSETVPIVYAQNYAQNLTSAAESSNRDQLVSPQITSNNLSSSRSSEMPLQAKFANSEDLTVATPISDRPTTKITSDSTGELLEPQTPASEHPIVSSEVIANPVSSTMGEMTLQAKFADSGGLASAISSPLRPSPLTTEPITQTISAYPVVVPKANLENFSVMQESPLVRKTLEISSEPLPIAQVKLPNPDLPSSDLPVVNRLNNLINRIDNSPSPSQSDVPQGKIAQSQVYFSDRSPNHVKPINSQILSPNSPIVTSAETSAIAENLISPDLESSQDYKLPIVRPKSTAPANILNVSSNINIKNIKGNQNPLPIVNPSTPNNLPKSPLYPPNNPSQNLDSRSSAPKTASSQTSSEAGTRELKVFTSPSPPTETVVSSMPNQPQIDTQVHTKIDVDAIANQVERKLMRRLVVESERRGHKR